MAHERYDLTEFEWNVIMPFLPNKARFAAPLPSRHEHESTSSARPIICGHAIGFLPYFSNTMFNPSSTRA